MNARAQTPSPLLEWQYSGGVALAELFEPSLPQWRVVLCGAAAVEPVYSGARADRVAGGPVINIRYGDVAFLSLGEGLGFNFLRDEYYHVGVSLGYDLGRRASDDYRNLGGLRDISPAPSVKLFASWVVSKAFPLVIRADARQIIGGADGALGDLEFYMPLPGSSRRFALLFGPAITWADRSYLRREFGVTPSESLASGHPAFDVHGGTNSVGLGVNVTSLITDRWLLTFDGTVSRLRGSSAESPITEARMQRALTVSLDYCW